MGINLTNPADPAALVDGAEALADLLSDRMSDGPLLLSDSIEQISGWKDRSDQEHWVRNRASLQRDLEWSLSDLGPRCRAHVARELRSLSKLAGGTAGQISEVLDSIRDRLGTPEVSRAAWQDLEDASTVPSLDLRTVASRVRSLEACLALRFGDAEERLRDAVQCLRGDPSWALPEDAIRDQEDSAATRVANALEVILREAHVSDCVAWLRYDHAQVSGPVTTVGHITFYNAQNCGPTAAAAPRGQLPHQEELHAAITERERESWWAIGEEAPPSVIARVDLGRRQWRGGLNDAEADVDAVLAIASTWADGIRWRRVGPAVLRTEGRGVAYSHSLPRRHAFVDWMGIGQTRSGLDEWLPQIDGVLGPGVIPHDLRESVRLLSEARLESSRESSLGAAQKIHERTALILRDQAFERVAATADIPPQQLMEDLRALLPYSQWLDETIAMVDALLKYSTAPRFAEVIRGRLESHSGPGTVNLIELANAQPQILALTMTRVERLGLRRLLRGLTDPRHYLRLAGEHADRLERLDDRHRRARNAIAHGNPVTAATIRSVLAFGETRATVAVTFALRAFAAGQSLGKQLRQQIESEKDTRELLRTGLSWREIWNNEGSS
ncbi:hypothetical protein AB2L57_09340 [Microbacterium sp. HA-8]|uniref:hypothetical protein n=1 Tax=Microbacterium sp. HA-8 TaxID=3234200 RepID=UPI0038F61E2B